MAVLGRILISSAERLDLPDVLGIDSFTGGDFKFLLKALVGADKPFVLKGFDVINPNTAIGSSSISIQVANSVAFYPGSNSGAFFYGLDEGNPLAAPLVPELRKNATNYVYLTLTTVDTSSDTRAFWDPDKDGGVGGEFTQDINTESVLQVAVNVSVASFPDNTIPICKVVVGPSVIETIEDARDMMFRLGQGGLNPDPFTRYTFRSLPNSSFTREEPATQMTSALSPNCFQGGDKNIYTLKEWMDVVMTKLAELGGTTLWYEDTSTYSLVSLFGDAVGKTLKSKGQWQHSSSSPGLLTWTEDVIIKSVIDPRELIIRNGSKTLANEQVMYLDLIRDQNFNSADQPVDWTNGSNNVNGLIGAFANLTQGDWIKKKGDPNIYHLRLEQFYAGVNQTGGITTAALARSVKLSGNYAGATESKAGFYSKGVYQPSDVIVNDRTAQNIQDLGGNLDWLAMRSDTIENVGNITVTTLAGTISESNGTTARFNFTAHGLVDGDRVTIASGPYAGTYQVEVSDANNFYINTTVLTNGATTARFATVTTASRSTTDGLLLENANHGFEDDQTAIIAGTSSAFDGAYQIKKRSATTFTIPFGSAIGSVSTGTATLAKIIIRTEVGLTKIVQGEIINIGDAETANIRSFIGMGSLAETFPNYFIPSSYGTLNGRENYNCIVTDNLTTRTAKLTAMMADKAQDKTVQLLQLDIDIASNTTNGSNQDITFSAFNSNTPTLNVTTPSSPGGGSITATGTLSLAANQVAYFTIDRNSTFTFSGLGSLTVAAMSSVPLDENVFIFAARLSGNDVWIWDGRRIPVGGAILSGGNGLGTIATLYDPVSTTLATGAPVTVDNVLVANNDTVLFSNLSSNNNRVYRATVSGGNVTAWTPLAVFNTGLNPSTSETVRFRSGDGFKQQLAVFDGTTFKVNDVVRYFNGTDYWEVSSLKTTSLSNNTTGSVFVVNFAQSENMIVDYSLLRGAVKETGTIHVTTDGVSAVATTTGAYIGSSGVAFSADIIGPQIRLRYTTTNTGSTATMKYYLRRWPNASGGPGGPPSYSGAGGGSGAAAGSNGNIQFNSAGLLAGNSNFNIDTVDGSIEMNGLRQTILSGSISLTDNIAIPTTLFTYDKVFQFAIIEYSITRNSFSRVGRLLVANDGTLTSESDDFVETGPTLASFTSNISGPNVQVLFTTANTGNNGVFKYSMRKWS